MLQCMLRTTLSKHFVIFQTIPKSCGPRNKCKVLAKFIHGHTAPYRRLHRAVLCSPRNSNIQLISNRTYATDSFEDENFSLEDRLIERWIYEVSPFGKLIVCSPFDLEISTLNPQEYPDMNKALITMITKEDGQNDKARSFSDIYNLNIEENKEMKTLTVTSAMADGIVLPIICSIKIPLKFDLQVTNSQPITVSIKKTECDNVNVQLSSGDCKLKTVKSDQVSVECKNGNILSQTLLQGNIKLKAGHKGKIKGKRMQGSSIQCESEAGGISIESIYADTSKFSACNGNVHLGNCHGNTEVKIDTGNLTVDSLDGNLTANIDRGNIDVFIERHENVKLDCKSGNITMKCRENLQSQVQLVADSLTVDENIEFDHTECQHGGQTKYTGFIKSVAEGNIDAQTKNGNIRISTQTWLSSVGLKFSS